MCRIILFPGHQEFCLLETFPVETGIENVHLFNLVVAKI